MHAGEDGINEPTTCDACGASTTYACAESLPPGAGAGDFDVALIVRGGPARAGTQVALGGVADIEIGKADGKAVQLLGSRVSRHHATLSRVDFGPGRWAIRDVGSTNGTFVNGARLAKGEPFTLSIGDRVALGDFELDVRDASLVAVEATSAGAGGDVAAALADSYGGFDLAAEPALKAPPVARPAPVAKPAGPGRPCKRCKATLAPGAKFCTGCGTDVATGKRAVLSKDIDENQLYATTESVVGPLSFLIRLGLFPIASVALGGHKPIATWAVTGLTAL
ncbi:FHA domain-containing protein, partial [bacterium]